MTSLFDLSLMKLNCIPLDMSEPRSIIAASFRTKITPIESPTKQMAIMMRLDLTYFFSFFYYNFCNFLHYAANPMNSLNLLCLNTPAPSLKTE